MYKTYKTRLKILTVTAAAWMSLLAAGCQKSTLENKGEYNTVAKDPRRDTEQARKHNAAGVGFLKQQLDSQAETEFKDALAADLFFGPAHNNLGTLYYRQEKYYLAAWEFQFAAKLMPNRAQPRNNLGLVFEAVGRLDDAAKWYDEALALEPESIESAGNLARIYVRRNRKDEKTRQLLQEVVMKDSRPEWIAWAKDHLFLLGPP
jgi:Tfp pilus assembly protein PilF